MLILMIMTMTKFPTRSIRTTTTMVRSTKTTSGLLTMIMTVLTTRLIRMMTMMALLIPKTQTPSIPTMTGYRTRLKTAKAALEQGAQPAAVGLVRATEALQTEAAGAAPLAALRQGVPAVGGLREEVAAAQVGVALVTPVTQPTNRGLFLEVPFYLPSTFY